MKHENFSVVNKMETFPKNIRFTDSWVPDTDIKNFIISAHGSRQRNPFILGVQKAELINVKKIK